METRLEKLLPLIQLVFYVLSWSILIGQGDKASVWAGSSLILVLVVAMLCLARVEADGNG